jgi:UDP-glucose 4-epimerase
MRILVTGPTGFIGRRLVSLLVAGGHEVAALVQHPHAPLPGCKMIVANLGELLDLTMLPTPVDAVAHLAQSKHYRDFPAQAEDIFNVNVAGTAALLNYAIGAGARSFVLASSGSVYADAVGGDGVNAALRPRRFYGASKVCAEALLWPYGSHLAPAALRLFTPYGPGQQQRLVPDIIDRVRTGRPVMLDGEAGGLRLAAAHVDDVAAVILDAVEQCWRGPFDVAAPGLFSLQDLAMAAGDLIGRAPLFVRTGAPEPAAIVPDLEPLSRVFPLRRLRDLRAGLATISTRPVKAALRGGSQPA